jgi:hypothetical protein
MMGVTLHAGGTTLYERLLTRCRSLARWEYRGIIQLRIQNTISSLILYVQVSPGKLKPQDGLPFSAASIRSKGEEDAKNSTLNAVEPEEDEAACSEVAEKAWRPKTFN